MTLRIGNFTIYYEYFKDYHHYKIKDIEHERFYELFPWMKYILYIEISGETFAFIISQIYEKRFE